MISEASRKILEDLNFSQKNQAQRQVPKETDVRKPEVFICELCSHKLASEACLDLHYETCRRRKGTVLTICISL